MSTTWPVKSSPMKQKIKMLNVKVISNIAYVSIATVSLFSHSCEHKREPQVLSKFNFELVIQDPPTIMI